MPEISLTEYIFLLLPTQANQEIMGQFWWGRILP